MAHAYLISSNNIDETMKILLNVIKNIFCGEYEDNSNKCSLCHLIDINNLPSLKIIEPDGNFIKKDQILALKNSFSKSSVITKEQVYIIKNAEKMNKEAANTMLKFLEEPDGNVISFFLTNHIDNVMLTIQSRCQHIDLSFHNTLEEDLSITKEKYTEYLEVITNYLKELEVNKRKLILNNLKISEYEKSDLINIFKIMLEIYHSKLVNNYDKINHDVCDYLNNLSKNNIYAKVKLITSYLNKINYNVNENLLLDSFVLEMDGINNENI